MPDSTYRGNIVADARVRAYTETCTQPILAPSWNFPKQTSFSKDIHSQSQREDKAKQQHHGSLKAEEPAEKAKNLAQDSTDSLKQGGLESRFPDKEGQVKRC